MHLPAGAFARDVRAEPASAVRVVSADGDRELVLSIDSGARVTLSAAGACATEAEADDVTLAAAFDVDRWRSPVGWASETTIEARFGCDEARGYEITWRELDGSGDPLVTEARGARVRVRTPAFSDDVARLPWGIVPFSPRTQGRRVLEATWHGPDGATLVRVAEITAAPRATGIPSLATGQEVFVHGDGLRIERVHPKDAAPALTEARPGLFRFRADTPSQTLLVDREGHPLSIRAGKHERVPLDCGRGECHASTTLAAQTSPMTHVLRHGLEGALGAVYDPACAVACHAAGEPGLADDGFVALSRALGTVLTAPHAGAWDELPRALRRTGGVTCTACHGPAAIPEPTARFAALRSDVCAVCHDAPPRYGHVVAWRRSKMAEADRDDQAASDPACERCHTTAGFLRSLSPAPRESPPAYANARPIGIACAACHAPHGAHVGALVREVPVAPAFAALDGASRICVGCHEEDAAKVWAGTTLRAHANLGCASCHVQRGGSESAHGTLGESHTFVAERGAACATCHADGAKLEKDAAAWIARARSALGAAGAPGPRPIHARAGGLVAALQDPIARALAAVVTDRGAYVHNAPFVRETVLAAEARSAR